MRSIASRRGARRWLVALLILLLAGLGAALPGHAQRPNGAGLVVRFGDGSLIYAYVQFEEETISGEELLYRSGLAVTIAPYAGLGAGVCSINGQGCPADNCFCQSYSTPAYFWHYYANDGGWRELLQGPSSRQVGDGDIDGWSWTAGDAGLPTVTIDEIALMNGVDRNPPAPPTETPTPTLEPTATGTPPPTATATTPPTATLPPAIVATMPPSSTPSPTSEPAATASLPAATGGIEQAARTSTSAIRLTPTATDVAAAPSSPTPPLSIVASATTVAVLVPPDGTPVPLEVTRADDGASATSLMFFGGLVAVAVGAGVVVYVWRGRVT